MILNSPYLLIAKIGAVAALLIAVWFHGRKVGENAVQADWNASRLALADQTAKLVLEHSLEMDAVRKRQAAVSADISQDFERKLDEVGKLHAAELDRVRKSGGLRVPATICSSSTSTGTQTASASGHHEESAPTVTLSPEITEGLFDLVEEADQLTEQLRSCQGWIRRHGFYQP